MLIARLHAADFDKLAALLAFAIIFLFGFFPGLGIKRVRFSLRTLLIVTTLVAVVLGLLVWAFR